MLVPHVGKTVLFHYDLYRDHRIERPAVVVASYDDGTVDLEVLPGPGVWKPASDAAQRVRHASDVTESTPCSEHNGRVWWTWLPHEEPR